MEHSRLTEHERDEIKNIISETMKAEIPGLIDAYVKDKGLSWKGFLVNFAVVLTAVAVIGGAAKFILGWIGFSYLRP